MNLYMAISKNTIPAKLEAQRRVQKLSDLKYFFHNFVMSS